LHNRIAAAAVGRTLEPVHRVVVKFFLHLDIFGA